MEPEFLIPAALLALGVAAGALLARIGAAIWAVLAALVAVAFAWLLIYRSHAFGWEGMGPGIVAVAFCLPLALGLVGGAGLGCWRRRRDR